MISKKNVFRVLLLGGVTLLSSIAFYSQPPPSADLVLYRGAIYTVNEAQPWAEAVAIKDGLILFVGSDLEVESFISNETEVIDLKGKMVMPGIHDVHLHVIEAGLNEDGCFLPAEASPSRYERMIGQCAQDQSRPWVLGAGVSIPYLLARSEKPIDLLDRIVPDRPALILDDLGHGAWANTQAMQVVGYDTLVHNPRGGIIHRDPVSGELLGTVLENAQQPLRTAAALSTPDYLEKAYVALLGSLEKLARYGITSVSDAGGYWPQGHETVWQRAEDEGTLTVRASNALYLYPDRAYEEQIEELRKRLSNNPESLLRFNQVKIYVDGILSQGTSALFEPYEGDFGLPDAAGTGFLYFETERLFDYITDLERMGFQAHIHVTGDRATSIALDGIEEAALRNGIQDRRHRLTHLYLVAEEEWQRFDALNVIADFQLAPSSTDADYADFISANIGDRADLLLPATAMHNAGAKVVLSSDWDADELSPFVKLDAVLYQRYEPLPDLETAIRMMTLDAAYLLHQEDKTGSIETAKLADLIVLDQNVFETKRIDRTSVLLTLLSGEEVYRDPAF